MKGHLALPTVAALALAATFVSLPLQAAENPPKGTITSVAGTGAPGYAGDNGPATQALLNGPFDLTFDAAGNLYVVDTYNDRVRKVSADGTITTVAGTGQLGFSGDNGKATAAQLKLLGGVVVDGAGNLFIADLYNHRVRKVTPDGIITTYAGSGPVDATSHLGDDAQKGGFSGDNGPATDARLNAPAGLAVDARGNLFIADYSNHRVRKVAPDGIITTVAGTGTPGFSGDSGKATDARLNGPVGLAVDSAGNLFVTEYSGNHRVRKVDAVTGIITTVAGNGHPGSSGDNGPATAAGMDAFDVAVDSAGNLFIADGYRVRKVDAVTGMITTVAGNGKQLYAGDGGLATDTGLRGPTGLAIDAGGNLLISDRSFPPASPYNERVLKVFGVAAPGLIAGMPFPMPKQP
jgi:trimeric autotransporter adhesin